MVTNAGGGLQHLPRPGRDPLARGPHPRRLGPVLLRPRPAQRARSGRPATSRSAGRPTSYEVDLLRRQGRVPPPRRRHRDAPGGHRLARRTTPRSGGVTLTNHDTAAARAGADQLRRGGAGAARAPTWPTRRSASCSWRPSACRPTDALLCRRRPRAADQKPVWAVHVAGRRTGRPSAAVQYETDRARFLGRGRTPADPAALEPGRRAVRHDRPGARPGLQPAAAGARRRRAASVSVAFTTAVADTPRGGAGPGRPVPRLRTRVTRAFELAWAHSQVELRHLQLSRRGGPPVPAAGRPRALRRPGPAGRPDVLAANRQGQPGLWRHGISGDLPIVLVRVAEAGRAAAGPPAAGRPRLLAAQGPGGRPGAPQRAPDELPRGAAPAAAGPGPRQRRARPGRQARRRLRPQGRPAVRRTTGPAPGRGPRRAGRRPRLAGRPARPPRAPAAAAALPRRRRPGSRPRPGGDRRGPPPPDLLFANGLGGFTPDGREYVIRSGRRGGTAGLPPAPWINVIANPAFGFLVSESGGGLHLGRQQPDEPPDALDQRPGRRPARRGRSTCATRRPARSGRRRRCRCGRRPTRHGPPRPGLHRLRAAQPRPATRSCSLFVPPDDPVKLVRLTAAQPRPPAAAAVGHVLRRVGARHASASRPPLHVVTELDAETGALLARNAFNADFAGRVAFADVEPAAAHVHRRPHRVPGPQRLAGAPAALGRVEPVRPRRRRRSTRAPRSRCTFELAPGEETRGRLPARPGGRRRTRPGGCSSATASPAGSQAALDEVAAALGRRARRGAGAARPTRRSTCCSTAGCSYQVLSCRVWGRSAFYQSGGAYGFRDQLQDVMALVYARPGRGPGTLLRAAGRQFVEGDVQHWWHPPAGPRRPHPLLRRLPLAAVRRLPLRRRRPATPPCWTSRCRSSTGPLLRPEQEEDYGLPEVSRARPATLYEHCVRALEHGWQLGPHGLPLMGTGDWNDGMNRVGAGGKGESVWDAWFQIVCPATVRRPGRAPRRRPLGRAGAAAEPSSSGRPSRSTPGTAAGTGARPRECAGCR